jgi:hypothetical protein
MDTSTLENIAEDLISHKLLKHGLLVAKPKCDHLGTDLLVFAEIADGVKFCRVQNKGRSLINSPSSNIKIPKDYVTNGFLVFLYLEIDNDIQELYVFLPNEIRQWRLSPDNEYQLSLSRSNSANKLESYKFTPSKIKLIQALIQDAETQGMFRALVFGHANLIGKGTLSVRCSVD